MFRKLIREMPSIKQIEKTQEIIVCNKFRTLKIQFRNTVPIVGLTFYK